MRLKLCQFFSGLMAVLTFLAVSGCASGPQLETYPRNEIERPYTLPNGVANWQIPMLGGYHRDNTGSSYIVPVPAPLVWQSSLSDTWTLNWGPLPLSASHQFDYSKDSVLGTTFGLNGFGYATNLGVQFFPSASFYWRNRFSEEWALEVTPGFHSVVSTKGDDTFRWNAGVAVGPLFQATEHIALRASVEAAVSSNYEYATLGDISIKPSGPTRFVLPLSVGGVWSFHRQWDFRAKYTFNSIGQANDYQSHTFLLNFVHFW